MNIHKFAGYLKLLKLAVVLAALSLASCEGKPSGRTPGGRA